ncbi:conserved hypothetical protein [Desulfofarcimen acetoxidans DSM 771]|uniref:Sporulation transcriptional regulator SpoIIID n=1 Tax=Desulfofarcimen acetoxidans (strain ATCC 49208 / DSM 771 / KCTC 5769 / VKM B-1644 / 5575) TaxID=485916 RepID=C8W0M3_DESAS|nr:sporulation transcriptional regulator SpoIIID [Desulfofarcimen acetoxidans]ACV63278.1 conserved hypothetical protein [Desulfofarcimen acetoxidans DSM 771]
MEKHIHNRVLTICSYILETQATVRQAAGVFGISKSTVHKDLTDRLPSVNKELTCAVKLVLNYNKAECSSRGGKALRQKYIKQEA